MLVTAPFSVLFWICYFCAGLSDILDGIVARRQRQQSDFGARLDSIADFVLSVIIAIILIANVSIPMWIWVWAAAIALLRFVGYIIGWYKYHAFSSLHTYANKVVGGMIFAFPLMYIVLGIRPSGALICAAASLSAAEEVLITITSRELKRDRKSIATQ